LTLRTRSLALNLTILGVAAHSVVLGLCLLSFPTWTLRLVGWEYSGEVFWPSQAGLFLIILGVAYGAAIRFRPLVWLLIGSKACALVFLLAHVTWLGAPRLAGLLGVGDGLMGLTIAVLLAGLRTARQPASFDGRAPGRKRAHRRQRSR
jgi:hypothetical protein